jgi:hypothetical protein
MRISRISMSSATVELAAARLKRSRAAEAAAS